MGVGYRTLLQADKKLDSVPASDLGKEKVGRIGGTLERDMAQAAIIGVTEVSPFG